MSEASFDHIAPYYDLLAGIVFGQRLSLAASSLISHLPEHGSLLWLGGGSGQSLPAILEQRPLLSIDYVDTSPVMRKQAAARIQQHPPTVRFTDRIPVDRTEPYSAVMMAFFLDLFSEEELKAWLQQLGNHLDEDSMLLVADFWHPDQQPWKLISTFLIPLMYRFFGMTTGLATRRLPDWKRALGERKLEETKIWDSLGGMIQASCWRIPSHDSTALLPQT